MIDIIQTLTDNIYYI